MSAGTPHPLGTIVELCARSAPAPWYPGTYAREAGVDRDSLDPHLDRLRLGGLIRLTDWVQGLGQGYELTPVGKAVVASPRLLNVLRHGDLPPIAPVDEPEPDDPAHDPASRVQVIERAFRGEGVPYVCWGIIWINIAVFMYGGFLATGAGVPLNAYVDMRPNAAVLGVHHRLGSLSSDDIFGHGPWWNGQWWRLVACCFIHVGGLLHLASNMYMLFMIGPLLERLWGHLPFLVLYLLTGVAGSCGALIEHQQTFNVGGASGAIWGVTASMATWLVLNRPWVRGQVAANIWRSLLNILLINVAITFMVPNVSKGGHFGGGIGGLVAALPLDFLRFGGPVRRGLAAASLLAILVFCVGLTIKLHEPGAGGLPRDPRARRDGVIPRVNDVVRLCVNTWQQVEPTVNRPPLARDADDVTAALEVLETNRALITREWTDIRQQPGGGTDAEAKAFALGADVAGQASALFTLADRCLRAGNDWAAADQQALARQERLFLGAARRWVANLK